MNILNLHIRIKFKHESFHKDFHVGKVVACGSEFCSVLIDGKRLISVHISHAESCISNNAILYLPALPKVKIFGKGKVQKRNTKKISEYQGLRFSIFPEPCEQKHCVYGH